MTTRGNHNVRERPGQTGQNNSNDEKEKLCFYTCSVFVPLYLNCGKLDIKLQQIFYKVCYCF